MEFGIRPPQDILDAIDIFLDYNDLPHGTYQLDGWQALGGINPFLEWEIKVSGTFEIRDPNNNWITISERTVDAFYFKDYEETIARPMAANDPNNPTGVDESFEWVEKDTYFPFRLRVAPEKAGTLRCKFKIEVDGQPTLESDYYLLDVINTGEKGFVKVGQTGRFLVRDGETFFPIGRNLIGPHCWNCENSQTPYGYAQGGGSNSWIGKTFAPEAYHLFLRDIEQVHDNGGRYFRMFSMGETLQIEFERLGNYTDRLHIAHELDRIFDKVDELDMMFQWDLESNAAFLSHGSITTAWDWHDDNFCNPSFTPGDYFDIGYCYHTELGLESPMDFLTSEDAFTYYEQRLRYIISRWGYSNNLTAISFMNEMDSYGEETFYDANCDKIGRYEPYKDKYEDDIANTPTENGNPQGQAIGNWAKRLAEYVKHPDKLGHDQHLIYVDYKTFLYSEQDWPYTGMKNKYGDDALSSPYIDILSFHDYAYGPDRYTSMQGGIINIQAKMLDQLGAFKPILISETDNGVDGNPPCELDPYDNSIERVRTLMASAFTGAAGAGLPWVRANDEWDEDVNAQLARYEAYLRLYMEDLDLDGENWTVGRSARDDGDTATTNDDHRADMVYLRRGDGLQATGFIQNRTYNFFTEAQENNLMGTACYDFDDEEAWTEDNGMVNYRFAEAVSYESVGVNALKVTGLNPNMVYMTGFYDGFYLVDQPSTPFAGPVPTSTNAIGSFTLPFPDLGIPDFPFSDATPCLLFRTEEIANPFRLTNPNSNELSASQNSKRNFVEVEITNMRSNSITSNVAKNGINYSVYPNPLTGNILHVDLTGSGSQSEDLHYDLLDAVGKVLTSGTFGQQKNVLVLDEYAAGTYNLRLWFEDSMESQLVIKQR